MDEFVYRQSREVRDRLLAYADHHAAAVGRGYGLCGVGDAVELLASELRVLADDREFYERSRPPLQSVPFHNALYRETLNDPVLRFDAANKIADFVRYAMRHYEVPRPAGEGVVFAKYDGSHAFNVPVDPVKGAPAFLAHSVPVYYSDFDTAEDFRDVLLRRVLGANQ